MKTLSRFKRYLPFLIIASLTTAVYFNSIYAPFQFDDLRTIVKNPNIRYLATDNIFDESFFARPILFIILKINYYFGGLNTFSYHLFNVILHISVSILIYLIASTISKEEMRGLPLLSSLIFAVHPINTEAVTYIISRSILLSTFFGLLTLLFFIKGMEAINEGQGTRNKYIILVFFFYLLSSIFCFLLALGSREDAVILPMLLIIYYFFFQRPTNKTVFLKNNIIIFAIILLVALTYPLTKYILTGNIGVSEATKFTPLTYLITEINAIVYYYIRLIIFPFNLNVDPDIRAVSSIDMATILAVAFIVFLFFFFRKSKILIFSLLWFFIALAPTSSIIPLLDAAAEHRLYLSMVGVAVLLAGCLCKAVKQDLKVEIASPEPALSNKMRFLAHARNDKGEGAHNYRLEKVSLRGALAMKQSGLTFIFICSVIIIFSIGVIKRNFVWNSEVSLWTDTARKSPFKARVYNALGLAYKREKGDYERSLLYYNKALSIQPLYADARINKGVIFTLKGDFDEALKEFNIALTLKPDSPQLHNNIGVIYIKKGDIDRAIEEFKEALKINPDFEDARKNLQLIRKIRGIPSNLLKKN